VGWIPVVEQVEHVYFLNVGKPRNNIARFRGMYLTTRNMCLGVYAILRGGVPALFVILKQIPGRLYKVADKNGGNLVIVVFIQGSKLHEFAVWLILYCK